MARKARPLTVRYTARARLALRDIWNWNADEYGINHADAYVRFLEDRTERLSTDSRLGKPVREESVFRYITIRRGRKGHGHVAVYVVLEEEVEVLGFYHTAQDWQTKIQ